MPAWQVLRPSVVASRFEALRGSALSPLVGRDEEIDLLLRRWARAKAGEGQVVLLSGEPGIGKSRIAAALEERPARRAASPSALFLLALSPGQRALSVYRPARPGSRVCARRSARDQAGEARGLAVPRRATDEDVAFLADLLSLPASERHPLPNLSPQRKKERTLEALIRQLEGLARQQPVADGLRGRALDRPDLARTARPHRRACPQPAGAADRDVPPRVPAALDRPAAGDDAGAQSPGPA